jgi:hypothetical protein
VTQTDQRAVCFVIMPFGGWLDGYYETIYKPAIESAGLQPHRADDLFRPSTIVHDIWAYTRQAKLLLADLTGKNPNVFYELGLAHAIGKPAILVAESLDDIPFDLRALRVIVYEKNDPRWGEQLQTKVTAAIKEVLKSPQEAVLPAFLHVRESSTTAPTVTSHERDIIQIKQEMDLLRRAISPRGLGSSERLSADEARIRIRDLVMLGVPDDRIVSGLEDHAPPEAWIRHQIHLIRSRSKGTVQDTEADKPEPVSPEDSSDEP